MNYRWKAVLPCVLAGAVLLSVFGCASSDAEKESAAASADQVASSVEWLDGSEMFTDRDKETGYDESGAVKISLNDDGVVCDSETVKISDNGEGVSGAAEEKDSEMGDSSGCVITISEEGSYILSGTLSNGQIVIEAEDSDKIQLVLNGVTLNCDTSAAIYVKRADKVFVTLAADSENTLSNKEEFLAVDENNVDAVIFSKEDLTLNGNGRLMVNAAYGHGIVSKDDLVITSGTYEITAADHALAGKDSVRIADGTFSLISGKDGIHAEYKSDTDTETISDETADSENTGNNTEKGNAEAAEDTVKGFIYIAGGEFQIAGSGDGMDASSLLQVDDGTIQVETNGSQAETNGNQAETNGSGTEDASTKGIKASGNLLISKGVFVIDSADDAMHSNSSIVVLDGNFQLSSGDDGIHADAAVTIGGGEIVVSESYEGIEGKTIEVTGGTIDVTAGDDGFNAAGGNDQSGFDGNRQPDQFMSDGSCFIQISGGTIAIDASGDGIDSNGNLYVSGGETYVSGPADDGNGALDYAGEAKITGGVVVALGSSGMAQNFGEGSSQGAMLVRLSGRTEGEVVLTNSEGTELVSYTPEKIYDSVLISCPQIEQGEVYTLTAGEQSSTIEMTSLIYGSGGMETGGQPGMEKMPDGGMEEPPGGRGEFPDGQGEVPDGESEAPNGDREFPDGQGNMPNGDKGSPDGQGEMLNGEMGQPF